MSNETQTAETSQAPAASAPAAAPAAAPAQPAASAPEASTLLTADPAAQGETSAAPAQNSTQTEEQGAETKTDEAKVEGAPEQYADFTAPEGVKFDEAVLGEFKEVAKELNLSQEKAQKVADLGAKIAQQTRDTYVKQIEDAKIEWANTSRSDKEFGGDKLPENMAVAKKALGMFGTPELTEVLRTSGLGNHPEFIRYFYRVGQQISDDKFVPGGKAPAGEKTIAQQLYPNMNP